VSTGIEPRTSRVDAADGTSLLVYEWTPGGEPRAAIHIAHGMGEHAARYGRVAAALAAAGYAVHAHDHRGHGGSVRRSREELGALGPNGWNGLVRDLSDAHARVRRRHPGVPFVAMGHSMGSFALQLLLLDESASLDGVVLSGSAALDALAAGIDPSRPASFEAFNAAFEPVRTEADWLSRDPDEVDAYVADPLCGFTLEPEAMGQLKAAAPRTADPAALAAVRKDLPVYVFAGDADPVNAGLKLLHLLVGRYREAGLARVETRFYPGGRHEMLNETNRDEVTRDLLDWLARSVSAR